MPLECRKSSLGFQPQLENKFCVLLNTVCENDESSVKFLNRVKFYLGECLVTREIGPKLHFWLKRLRSFINIYRLRFSKEDHITFIKLIYNILDIIGLDEDILLTSLNVLLKLLKWKRLLSPKELTLDWKILDKLYTRNFIESNNKYKIRPNLMLKGKILTVISSSKPYFTAAATEEIFNYKKSKLYPLDPLNTDSFKNAAEYIRWFIPTITEYGNSPQHDKWLPHIMSIWESYKCYKLEESFMALLAHTGINHVGLINWEPYMGFIYSRILASFHFPVHFKETIKEKESGGVNLYTASLWIISTLGGGSNGQFYLTKLMQFVAPYCHSVNNGLWTKHLMQLYESLVQIFSNRLKRERRHNGDISWAVCTSNDNKLNDNDIDEFFNCLFRQPFIDSLGVSKSVQILAALKPNVVLPTLIQLYEDSINDICKPWKNIIALQNITAASSVFVNSNKLNYPNGITFIIPTLAKIIGNIRRNDMVHVLTSLLAIAEFLENLPIVDSSMFPFPEQLTTEEAIVNADTIQFEEIILQVVNIIFDMIDTSTYLPTRVDSHSVEFTTLDVHVLAVINSLMTNILPNLSEDIFNECLNKWKQFLLGGFKEIKVSGQYIAIITACFCQSRPKLVLPILLPPLCDCICSSVNQCGNIKEDESKEAVLYYLCVTSKILNCQSTDVLQYNHLIERILESVIHFDFRDGVLLTSELLSNVLQSLSSHKVIMDTAVSAYSTSILEQLPIKDWGLIRDLSDVKLIYCSPGPNEIKCVNNIIQNYIWPSVESLNRFIANDSQFSRDEIEKHLNIVKSLTTINAVLPAVDEPCSFETDSTEINHMSTFLLPKLDIKTPTGENMRTYLLNLMIRLHVKLSECDEDNTRAFEIIIEILSSILHQKVILKPKPCATFKNPLAKKLMSIPYIKTNVNYVLKLIQHEETYPLTKTICDSINTLLQLTLSHYPKVSCDARSSVHTMLKKHPKTIDLIIPFVENTLSATHSESAPEYKNILTLLCMIVNNKRVITTSDIWPYILKQEFPHQNITIGLFSQIMNLVSDDYSLRYWLQQIPDDLVTIAHSLCDSTVNPSNPNSTSVTDIEIGRKNEIENNTKLKKNYAALVEKLLQHNKLYWQFEKLRLIFLRKLSVLDISYSPSVLRLVLNTLLDSSADLRKEALICFNCSIKQFESTIKPEIEIQQFLEVDVNLSAWSLGEDSTTDLIRFKKDRNYDTKFLHKSHIGYISWPRTIFSPKRPYACNKILIEFFTPENIATFYRLFCCDPSSAILQCNILYFFKHLFRNAKPLIHLFLNEAKSFLTSNHEWDQFLLISTIEGAIMSMKYWEMEVQEDIFSMVMPLIKQSIEELSPTMDLWSSCFSRIFHNRDPNTMEKLYNYLSDWTLHDVTFSTVLQRKTHFLCQSMLSNHWKLAELNKHILTKVTPFLDNPYQSFREAIAKLLYIIFLPDVEFNNVHSTRSPHAAQFFNDVLLPRLKFLNSPKQNIDDEEYKKNKLLLKTVCCWLNMASLCQRIWPEAYQLVGILCQTRRNDLNSETSVLCTKSLNFLAKNVHTKSHFLKTFDYIYFVFTNDNLSSNAKISLLQFTQVFVFHNIPYLFSDNNRISKISDVIVNFLFDLDVDVKHATRAVLRDFLRCNMSDVQVLIDRFTQGCSKPVISNKKESISTIQGNILGLLAVIDASPYEIPDYIVNILETLSQHLMDPHPIPNWIATAVDNFRHTQPNKLLLIEKVPSDLLQLLSGSKLTYYS